MSSLVFFALWTLARSQGTAPPRNQNIVRICSLAAGASSPTGCQDLDARLLEPATTAAAGGQRAFVDPETKRLVQPTRDQLREISVVFSESMDQQEDVKTVILPNGTVRLPGTSFTVNRKAVLATPEAPKTETKTEKKP
jgi:hypothetical protein